MRTIERSSKFKKDYRRESKGKHQIILDEILTATLTYLVNDEDLETRYQDHNLSGNWDCYRECHIKPDLLLIYSKPSKDVLRLARMGSHSELFN
jgi:mRNA interferase YafQ